jgi:D-alanyl-D-alanine carboxypeptidase
MAKKIDLRTDPHALDSSLDLPDFGLDEIESSLSADAKDTKSRNPVIDVFRGSIEGATDKFKDPAFLGQVTRDALPKTYGKIFSTADSAAETATSLYNDAVKELKPQVSRIAKRVDSLVPAESKRLKGLTTKIKDFFGDEAPMPGTSKEEVQDQSIHLAISSVFGQLEDKAIEREARENSQKRVGEQLEGNRFEMNYGLLSGIRDSVARSASYTEKVEQAFQRKSLELQYRSYFAQAELLATSTRYYEMFSKQYEAIAKNTALPEFVKIKNSERFKEMARTKFIDSIQNSLFGSDSVLGRGFKKMAADAKEYIGGIKQGLEAASMGIDAVEAIQEQNKLIEELGGEKITAAKLAGNAAGQWGANKLGEFASDKVRDKLDKVKPVVDFGARISGALTNPGGAINSLRDYDSFQEKKNAGGVKGTAYGLLDRGLSYFTDQSPDMRINNPLASAGNEPSIFNSKTQRSITDVIPGYLARILREVYILRSGDDSANLVSFDQSSGKFLDKAIMAKKIKDKLADSVKRTGFDWRLQNTTNEVFGRDKVEGDELGQIKKFFANVAKQGNLEFTPEKIQRTETFKKLDSALQAKIKEALEGFVGDSEDKDVNQYKLTQSLSSVRDATPDIRADIERYINDGYAEILEDEGIIKQDKDGSYVIDEEKYYVFVQESGIVKSDKTKKTNITPVSKKSAVSKKPTPGKGLNKLQEKKAMKVASRRSRVKSDETTKEDIHPLSPRRALNAVKNTGIFDWFYKKGEGPQDPKRGPMAQDVNRTMGEDAAPGGKQIDLTTMNGNNMAAIQALNERQEKLMKDDKSQNYLEGIYGNTSKIIEILEGGGGFGGKGGSSAKAPSGDSNSYGHAAGEIISNVGNILGKATKDLTSSAKKVGSFTKDKVIKPGAEKMSEFYEDHKDSVKNSIGRLLSTASNFASRALTTAQDVVFNKIPSAARTAMIMGDKLKNMLRETFNKTTDIYIQGRKSPVLQAELMKAGYYIDSITGKAIENMDDLRKIKGDIKNRAGRVVLRIEDAAKGMYDSNGQKVRASFEKVKDFVWGVAKEGFGRAKTFWKGAAEQGKGVFDKLRGKAQSMLDKLKDKDKGVKLSNPFENMSMPGLGLGLGTDKIYDVLVEIRDLMRGDDRGRHEDGYESSPTFVGPKRKTLGEAAAETKESVVEKAMSLKDVVSKKIKKVKEQAPDQIEVLKDTAKKKATKAKEDAKERVRGIRDRIKDRIDEGMERNEARKKKVELKEPEARYKSGTNAIDKIIGIGSTLKDKFTAMGGKKGLKDKATGTLAAVKGAKGIKGKALAGIASLFGGASATSDEAAEEPKDKMKSAVGKKKAVEVEDAEVKPKAKKEKKKADSDKEPAFNDTDGNGRRDGSFRDRLEKDEERNQARKKKVVFNEPEARYKADKNVIDTIMDKAKGIFGMITGGLGSVFGTVSSLISGASSLLGLGGSAGGIIGKLGGLLKGGVGTAAKGVGGAVGMLGRVGSVVKNVASVGGVAARVGSVVGAVRNVALVGSLVTGGAASAVMGAVGTGLAAIGSVLASPVVLGALAVGAVGFGLYKLYKYANRDNVNEFEDIRMKQYGVGTGESTKKYNHFLLTLEAYLTDGRVGYNRGQAYLLDKKIDPKELADLFGIDKDDKERAEIFSSWFQRRFKPFFLTHMTALYSVDPKAKLDEVNKLPVDQKLKYLGLIGFESGPYDVTTSPFKDLPQLNGDKTFALNAIKNLIAKLGKDQKASDKKTAPPTVKPVVPPVPPALQKKEDKPTDQPKPTVPQTDADKKKDAKKTSGLDAMQNQGEDGAIKESKTLGPTGTPAGAAKMSAPLKEAGGPRSDGSNWSQYVNLKPGVSLEGMNPEMLSNFRAMVQEYGEKTGKKITVNSGARSVAEQEALYKKDPTKAAKPGRSLHEFGLALDAQSSDLNALDEMGLMRKYGFTRPVGGETWHMEPAGIQVDIQRAKKDGTFASTAIEAGLNKGGGGVGSIKGSPLGKRDATVARDILFSGSAQKVADKSAASAEDKTVAMLSKEQPKGESKPVAVASATAAPAPASAAGVPAGSKPAANDAGPVSAGAKPGSPADTKLAANEPKPTVPEKQVKIKTLAANNDSFSKMEKLPDVEAMPDSKSAGIDKIDMLPPIDISKPGEVKKAVAAVAQRQGQDPNMMTTFAAVESSLKPNAKGGGTSEGLFGFTRATWNEQMSKNARKFNIPESTPPTDVRASTILASEYVRENKAKIKQYKPNPTLTDVYLTHFLGPTGSRKFLSADPNAIAAEILPNAAAANKAYFYENGRALTVSEVYQKIDKKLQKVGRDFGIDLPASPSLDAKPGKVAAAGGESANSGSMSIGKSNTASGSPTGASSASQTAQASQTSVSQDPAAAAASVAQAKTTDRPRAPEVASAPVRPSGYSGPGTTVLTPRTPSARQPSQDSFAQMDSLVDVGTQQLGVQKKMLEALQVLTKNLDPETLKALLSDLPVAQSSPQAPASTQTPQSSKPMAKAAVDLRRKVA